MGSAEAYVLFLLKAYSAIDFRSHIDNGGRASVLGEEVFVPLEAPLLELWSFFFEEFTRAFAVAAVFGDAEGEGFIRYASVVGFRAVDRSVDLEAQVKELTYFIA